ncbi:MAG: Lrp/AsnC family transcriptional regulator [Candidatus Bilamarchaeaceae archaeon]
MQEKTVKIDKKDIEILKELRENCRNSVKNIAVKVKMHPNTILQRIKRLERLGVIRGYKADINFRKIGYDFHALVMLRSKKPEVVKDEETVKKLLRIAEIESLYVLTGESDWAVVVRAIDREHFMNVLNRIQEETQLRTITSVILHTHKYPYEFNPL